MVVSPFIRFWNNLTALQTTAVIFALVLTIGVVVEYRYELKQLAWLLIKLILGKSTPFDRCVLKKLSLHSIGPILVVVGIAGELIFEGRTFMVEDRQAGDAAKAVAALYMNAEIEQLERVKIEASVARRKLSKEQQSMIADHLKRFAGMKVVLSYLAGDPEAQLFAEDIAGALRAANCKVPPIEPFILFGRWGGGAYPLHPLTGVDLGITKNRSSQDARGVIQRELCSLGFDTAFISKVEPEVDVLVVAKPNSPQGLAKLTIDAKTPMKTCTASP
jgi:hypothetical protein